MQNTITTRKAKILEIQEVPPKTRNTKYRIQKYKIPKYKIQEIQEIQNTINTRYA